MLSFSPLLQSRPQSFFPVQKMCIPQLLSHQFEFLLRCNQLFLLEKGCIHFFLFEEEKKSQLMNKVYLDRSVKKLRKTERLSVLCPRLLFLLISYLGFVTIPPFPLLFFFVVGHPSRCIPYTMFKAKKNIKRNKKTEKMQKWFFGSNLVNG